MLQIIGDILDISKIEAGKLDLRPSTFDVRACVEKSLDVVASRAQRKGLDLVQQLHHSVPFTITQDQSRLTQILFNLLSNAIKFSHRGEVVVDLTLDEAPAEAEEKAPAAVQWKDAERASGHCLLHFAVQDSGIGRSCVSPHRDTRHQREPRSCAGGGVCAAVSPLCRYLSEGPAELVSAVLAAALGCGA